MGLKRITDPASAVITTAEAKKHLELRSASTHHDTYLDELVSAATEAVERHTGRALITQTWRLTLCDFPEWQIKLPRPPLASVSKVDYVDQDGNTQTWSSANYRVLTNYHPGRLTPVDGEEWPEVLDRHPEAVVIEYVAGYGSASEVPATFKHAIKLMMGRWFMDRDDSMPPAAANLLKSLKIGQFPSSYNLA